ncbi:MAG: MerR family DNA-binding protein [Bradymonadaceae bacterium]
MGRTIGTLAEQAGVDVETIRYYQRIDLIDKPPKPTQGWREYPDETLKRLRFIKRAQSLGFTLDEIGTLLELDDRAGDEPVRREMREFVDRKLDEIRAKIRDLKQIEGSLSGLAEACVDEDGGGTCPILEEFRFSLDEESPEVNE